MAKKPEIRYLTALAALVVATVMNRLRKRRRRIGCQELDRLIRTAAEALIASDYCGMVVTEEDFRDVVGCVRVALEGAT